MQWDDKGRARSFLETHLLLERVVLCVYIRRAAVVVVDKVWTSFGICHTLIAVVWMFDLHRQTNIPQSADARHLAT